MLPYVVGGNKLTKTEQKYCSCLMHVRPKTGNPYGICTKSVYGDVKRDNIVDCDLHYDYKKYSTDEIKSYGKEKKINTKLSRNKIIDKLEERKKYKLKKY